MDKEKGNLHQPIATTQSTEMIDIYANTVHLEWTLYDVRIRFGQLMFVGDPSQAKLTVEERVGVTIAWGEAKFLRDSLAQLIARHEEVNGEIKPPKLTPSD